MITRSAYSGILSPGDKITILDTLGINTSSCDESNGYTELREIVIRENGTIGGPKTVLPGINHCQYEGGQKRVGFIEGNPIIFKITHSANDSSYFVQPSLEGLIGSSSFAAGGHTVVRNIDYSSPLQINSYEFNSLSADEEDRDFDAFNVYNKNTSARDCDTPGTGENQGWCFDTLIQGETCLLYTSPSPRD